METIGWPLYTVMLFGTLAGFALLSDVMTAGKKDISLVQAISQSVAYILFACIFGGHVWLVYGADAGSRFFAGYLMEKALSVDNLMVFTAIFSYFHIHQQHTQRHILHWGIAGAIVFRAVFVGLGVGALMAFGVATELIFGALVAWSAWALLQGGNDDDARVDYSTQWYVKIVKKIWPVIVGPKVNEQLFWKTQHGWWISPAFICLATIEVSDIMFSFDSVPAVIGITQDPLLVYSAVIFAILGLRALYFVLHALRRLLVHLDKAVAVVLVFIAGKLMTHALFGWHISPLWNVIVVLGMLSVGVIWSLVTTRKVATA